MVVSLTLQSECGFWELSLIEGTDGTLNSVMVEFREGHKEPLELFSDNEDFLFDLLMDALSNPYEPENAYMLEVEMGNIPLANRLTLIPLLKLAKEKYFNKKLNPTEGASRSSYDNEETNSHKPNHYKKFGFEVWEMEQKMFGDKLFHAHLQMVALEYQLRMGHKPGQAESDQRKIQTVLDKIAELEKKNPNLVTNQKR